MSEKVGYIPPPPPPGPWGAPTPSNGAPPDSYLLWAILSTIFCCLPLGVVSIVFAAKVSSLHAGGDVAGALDASNKAKSFAIAAAATGLAVVLLSAAL